MTAFTDSLHAAEAAERATLWAEAARCYEEALTLLTDGATGGDEAALLTALGRCYWNMSDARAAWRTLRRAMSLYQECGDGVGLARATVEILRIWGPPDRQQAMAEQALEALGERDLRLRAHLLMRLGRDDEALRLADTHGFEELQVVRTERGGWDALNAGRIEDGIAALRIAHERYAAAGLYHPAAGTLRGAGFSTLQSGRLDDGERLAAEAVAYARGVHLRFSEQLALMDLAGVAFARCDFARCEELTAASPAQTDFRADAYRMWMTELRGDLSAALSMLIDPERGGGALTAISQIHASSAGVLHHAGRDDAARRELDAWAEVARRDKSFPGEAAAVADCLVELGGDDLLREVYDAYANGQSSTAYATLQGRCTGYTRGALALRLGLVDEAEARFRDGLSVAERERCPVDAARCLEGLARVAAARWQTDEMDGLLRRARELYGRHGARLYLDRMAASS